MDFKIYFILLITPAYALTCNHELKQGPYVLTLPNQTLPNITRLEIKIHKFNLTQETTSMSIGYRARWSAYCYNGGALDMNTGCFSHLFDSPPTKGELEKWSRMGQCEICNDATDAWGSSSSICLAPIRPCNVWVTKKELIKKETNNRFPYHTCEISWRCGISTSKIPVTLKMDMGPKIYIPLPNGTLKLEEDFFHIDGQTSILIANKPTLLATKMNVKCVKELDKYWCIDPDNHIGFRISESDPYYCTYSICYQWVFIAKPEREFADFKIKHASLDDLATVFAKEMLELEDLKYTVLQMAQRLILMEKIMLKTISSVAKIDDRLLQTILDGSFTTEFISQEQFFIKPCVPAPKVNSNCVGNKIYLEGRWIINDDPSKCINLLTFKHLDIFSAIDIWLPEVSEQKTQGTPDEYTGWSFYANSKRSLIDTMYYTRNGGKGTSMKDILNLPEGDITSTLASLWGFSFFNSATIVIFIIIIFIVCKKL